MSPRSRSAWRRRIRRGRKTQVAVTAVVSVAIVVVAIVAIALVDKGVSSVNPAAFGNCASGAAAQASDGPNADPSADPSAAPATPCPTQTDTTQAAPRVPITLSDFAAGPIATTQLGGVATNPVDGTGDAINLHQSADEATQSGNCTLWVPWNPLTAQGLATPYRLGDGCSMANQAQQAFVEATILSPNGQVQVYNPLIITQGTRPARWPAAPRIPRGSRVILDFGFNGTNLVLTGPGAFQRASGCVDALGQSVIGQVSACDAVAFYAMANAEIARGTLKVPALGTAADGQPCQTTREFALIDQDQSDNSYSQYLLDGRGRTAQATAANKARMGDATVLTNGSDNALLGYFVDPANGCKTFTANDPTSMNGTQSSQALDELSARVNQKGHVALVPTNDPMTLVGGDASVDKTNVYRSLVDQPLLAAGTDPAQVAASYCMNMVNIAPAHDQLDASAEANTASPVPAVGTNLATFLGNRLSMSFTNLGCDAFGLTDPVTVTAQDDGPATAVSYNTAQQQATLPGPQAPPGQGTTGNGTPAPTTTGNGTTGTGTGTGRHRPPWWWHGHHHWQHSGM
jgi:hypothetical protein